MSSSHNHMRFITEPYAYSIIEEALTQASVDSPGIGVLTLVEEEDHGVISVCADGHIHYDPEMVMNTPLNLIKDMLNSLWLDYLAYTLPVHTLMDSPQTLQ